MLASLHTLRTLLRKFPVFAGLFKFAIFSRDPFSYFLKAQGPAVFSSFQLAQILGTDRKATSSVDLGELLPMLYARVTRLGTLGVESFDSAVTFSMIFLTFQSIR